MSDGLFGTRGEASSVPSVFKFNRFSQRLRPRLNVGGVPHVLEELNNEGFVAIAERQNANVAAGITLPWTLTMPQGEILRGLAELISHESRRRGCHLAYAFRTGCIDPQQVYVETHAAQLMALVRETRDPSTVGIDIHYRALCADVVARLQLYRKTLDEIASTKAADHVLAQCTEELIKDWDDWSQRATEMIGDVSEFEKLNRYRAFTALTVTPHLTEGPVWRRAFDRPRGYPGDYGVMHHLYARKDQGTSLYGQLCHRLGLHFAKCVPSRKDFIRQSLLEQLDARNTLLTTSIACGPAQEIVDLAQSMPAGCHLKATLLDQDPEAILFATNQIADVSPPAAGTLEVETRCHHFGDLSDEGSDVVPPGQDVIYCFGMYDYLPEEVVRPITKLLYDRVKPGGVLIVGNLKSSTPLRWGLSFVLGYDMWYRSRDEMLSWASDLPGAKADLHLENTGNNYLLYVHKR